MKEILFCAPSCRHSICFCVILYKIYSTSYHVCTKQIKPNQIIWSCGSSNFSFIEPRRHYVFHQSSFFSVKQIFRFLCNKTNKKLAMNKQHQNLIIGNELLIPWERFLSSCTKILCHIKEWVYCYRQHILKRRIELSTLTCERFAIIRCCI